MPKSKIPWCDHTHNLMVGCPLPLVSPGCEHCWARAAHNQRHKAYLAGKKLPKMYAHPFEVLQYFSEPFAEIFNRKKATVYFVGSQTDVFHKDAPFWFLLDLYEQMCFCCRHTFIILTKRPKEMVRFWHTQKQKPLPNVFHYVTICNQAEADEKIPQFLEIDCGFHGINIEPMLGPVDLRPWIADVDDVIVDSESGRKRRVCDINLRPWTPAIDHVIVGCESGKHRRPCDTAWIENLLFYHAGNIYIKQIQVGDDNDNKVVTNPKDYPEYWIGHRVLPWKVQR